jgi:hypothetical protein
MARGAKNHEALKKVAGLPAGWQANRLPHRKHPVFHEVSRAERPSQQGRKTTAGLAAGWQAKAYPTSGIELFMGFKQAGWLAREDTLKN